MLKSNSHVTSEGILSEIRSQYFEQSRTPLKTWDHLPRSLAPVCPSAPGNSCHLTLSVSHPFLRVSLVLLLMVGGYEVMPFESYFLVGCWTDTMVFPNILSVWLATESRQGPLRIFHSVRKWRRSSACVWCGMVSSKRAGISREIVFTLVACFHHILGRY